MFIYIISNFSCNEECPAGTHGAECKQECRCQNGGKCDPSSGKCDCPSGWMGSVCANRCPANFYGQDCETKCDCFNGADCHHITGQCYCKPGFVGEKVCFSFVDIVDLAHFSKCCPIIVVTI